VTSEEWPGSIYNIIMKMLCIYDLLLLGSLAMCLTGLKHLEYVKETTQHTVTEKFRELDYTTFMEE
jgi:hypothetical protein